MGRQTHNHKLRTNSAIQNELLPVDERKSLSLIDSIPAPPQLLYLGHDLRAPNLA
jgi:hypothetical protein